MKYFVFNSGLEAAVYDLLKSDEHRESLDRLVAEAEADATAEQAKQAGNSLAELKCEILKDKIEEYVDDLIDEILPELESEIVDLVRRILPRRFDFENIAEAVLLNLKEQARLAA